MLLIILCVGAIRFRLRDMPLERDEGEFAYAGQLMLEGIPPYQLAANMKLPGTYAAYAMIMAVFGETPAGIHLGLLLVNAAAILLVFRLTAGMADRPAGVAAAAVYASLSLSSQFVGAAAHATQFVALAVLAGLLLLLRGINRRSGLNLFLSGICLGAAVLLKQHAAFFVLFAAAFLAYRLAAQKAAPRQFASLATMLALGVLAPLALTAGWLWQAGVFGPCWFWTVQYARQYALGDSDLPAIISDFIHATPAGVWVAFAVAIPGWVLLWRKGDRTTAVFTAGLLACSFLTILPGFKFRGHYYILLLPALALLAGMTMSLARRKLLARHGQFAGLLPGLLLAGIAVTGGSTDWEMYFHDTPAAATRRLYGSNPFPESPGVAEYLERHCAKSDVIAVLGSEPQIYFYAHRHSATRCIYMYPLTEKQPYALKMQEQMIGEIESAHPAYLVWVECRTSWLVSADSGQLMFRWFDSYVSAHYEKTGIVEIFSPTRTEFRWDDAARDHPPATANYLTVYKLKPGG